MKEEKGIDKKGLRTKKKINKFKRRKSIAEIKYKKRKEELRSEE